MNYRMEALGIRTNNQCEPFAIDIIELMIFFHVLR